MTTSPRKGASPKRANLPRPSDHTREFAKDWERLTRSGRYNMRQLKEAMLLLISNNSPLGPEWRDHELVGDWADHRECHIGGDFLLIYKIEAAAPARLSSSSAPAHTRICSNDCGVRLRRA